MAVPATCDLCDEAPPAVLVTLLIDGTSLYACVPCLNALTLQLLEQALGGAGDSPTPSPSPGPAEPLAPPEPDTPGGPESGAPTAGVEVLDPSAPSTPAPAPPKSDATDRPPPDQRPVEGKEATKATAQRR